MRQRHLAIPIPAVASRLRPGVEIPSGAHRVDPAIDPLVRLGRAAGNRALTELIRSSARDRPPPVQRQVDQQLGWGPSPPLLRFGSRGGLVRLLQGALNDVGAASPLLSVDGIFGPRTHRAVRQFQSSRGLAADGLVGPKTRAALQIAQARPTGGSSVTTTGGAAGAAEHAPELTTHTLGVGPQPGGMSSEEGRKDTGPTGSVAGAYEPGEIESSAQSGGQVVDNPPGAGGGVGTALLFDFEPCSSAIRPVHAQLIGLVRTRLGWSHGSNGGRVLQVFGTMDEIETFIARAKLDGQRAAAVMRALDPSGSFTYSSGCPSCPKVDVVGAGLGMGGTADQRAIGRSVFVKYEIGKPKKPVSPWPADKASRKWEITSGATVMAPGYAVVRFQVRNLASGKTYDAVWTNTEAAVLGGGFSGPLEENQWTPFTTVKPVQAWQFDGTPSRLVNLGLPVPKLGLGFSAATIRLPNVTTSPRDIPIGGLEVGFGLPAAGIAANGVFTVLPPGK